jgi:hypothetical protein
MSHLLFRFDLFDTDYHSQNFFNINRKIPINFQQTT